MKEIKDWIRDFKSGRISRRDFVERAATGGLSLLATTSILGAKAQAEGRGGEINHQHNHGHDHHHNVNRHDERIRAFCITRERPISWTALSGWLDALATMRGDDLLRLKAIIAIADRPEQPVVLHGVQHLFHPPVLLPAWPDADRRTRIVFITRDLPQETIEESLAAFEAADEPLAAPP